FFSSRRRHTRSDRDWSSDVCSSDLRWSMALFWLCLGLGYSAKGPAGLMPLLPCAVFLVIEHGWRGLGRLHPLMGVAIVALVSARSEERRVGKECRSGGVGSDENKNK